ncbi:MAG: hypothetical protein MJE68_32900 [Proteobacteria bacterium]|nr:hypothetical protein [Pseudomonadota bacterium]
MAILIIATSQYCLFAILVIKRTLFIKRMPSSCHKLLFIKRMCLIGVAFYELELDPLESIWSPAIFGEMMATSNVMQEDRHIASTRHLERQL